MWTKKMDGTVTHYPLFFHPRIYIAQDIQSTDIHPLRSLDEIAAQVKTHEKIISISKVFRYLNSASRDPVQTLQVEIVSFSAMKEVVDLFKFHRYNLYNIDINHRQHFFLDTKAYPMGKCHVMTETRLPHERRTDHLWIADYQVPKIGVELKRIKMYDNPSHVFYKLPPLVIANIKLTIDIRNTFPDERDQLMGISLSFGLYEDETFARFNLSGTETEILHQLVAKLEQCDPDFLLISKGDKFAMNYLASRANVNGLTHRFWLGRLRIPMRPREKREGQVYMTYGVILHKEPVYYIPGRIHLDYDNSFLLYESEIAGLIDMTRLAATPVERTSRASIGTVLTGVEFVINAGTVPETLVPPSKSLTEIFKPGHHLLIADNGGLTYPSTPGVYDRVWALDFISLYPHIMLKHNIGNETVLCRHQECFDRNVVPDLGYHICGKQIGVVTKTMKLILQKRLRLKYLKTKLRDKKLRSKIEGIDSAHKWILVCCFGYLGFKNSRWGSIESHQCVTAYARYYLNQARKICDEMGFDLLMGIVDSLFIRAKKPDNDSRQAVTALADRIATEVGIPISVEGKFNWIVYPNVKDYQEVAALNRYFGYFNHEEFKLRGIRSRQRRVTKLEKKFQAEVLKILAHAKTADQFVKLIPTTYALLSKYKQAITSGNIDPSDLIIRLKTHVGDGNYQSRTQQSMVVEQYSIRGESIPAGKSMEYLVADDRIRTSDRITIAPLVMPTSRYDKVWYCKLLDNALFELVEAPQIQYFGKIRYNDVGEITGLDDFWDYEKEGDSQNRFGQPISSYTIKNSSEVGVLVNFFDDG